MAVCAVIATTMGQGQAHPRLAQGLIFGVIASFVVILFILQRSDLGRAEAASLPSGPVPETIDNPATLNEATLWAAMAVRPVDADAVEARSVMWKSSRRSLRLGMLITLLIFLSVPPIYLFDTFVPLMIGFPLIVLLAVYGALRAMMPGVGDVAQGFETMSRALAPLGLAVTGRPNVKLAVRAPVQPGMSGRLDGAIVISGNRHGRAVTVTIPTLEGTKPVSQTMVAAPAPEFSMKSRDGRIVAVGEAPEAVKDALAGVKASTRWNGVKGSGGPDGIALERKGQAGSDWLLDLWLGERLADALSSPS